MTNINLLPWRDNEITFKNRLFSLALGVACIIIVGITFSIKGVFALTAAEQQKSVSLLKSEIQALNNKIKVIDGLQKKRDLLISRQKVIHDLQNSRLEITHLLNDLVAATPDGIYLTQLERKGNTLTINGASSSNSRISEFMVNLKQSPLVKTAILEDIMAIKGGKNKIAQEELEFNLIVIMNNFKDIEKSE